MAAKTRPGKCATTARQQGTMNQQRHWATRGRRHAALACAILAGIAPAAWATDGYFQIGYGIQAKGRGGTALALASDAFGGANNPATLAFATDQVSVGLDAFNPQRGATRSGLGPGLDGGTTSHRNWFGIPQFAYNHHVTERLALGVSVYGNGGMDTDYPGGAFNCGRGRANMLCGTGHLGVDLSQVVVAPTLAYQVTPHQSIGIAPLLVYQRFAAMGLQAFAGAPGLSSAPARVTDRGHDGSTGAGVRVGYYARLNPAWAIGASYSTRAYMSRFHDYAGLFAGHGGFDLPVNWGVGVAFTPTPAVTLSLDYNRIDYRGVASVGNPSTARAQLGAANGPGFGWRDVNVWKFGVEWHGSERWTWRAGFNHVDDPITPGDVTFNILAPGVVTNHVTLGFSRTVTAHGELSVAYMHAFAHAQSGVSILPVFMGGAPAGTERLRMHEDSLGVQYTWRLP